MNPVRNLILALTAVSLATAPAAAAPVARDGAAVEESEALGGSLLNGDFFIIPLIAIIAVILALTVSSDEVPVSS